MTAEEDSGVILFNTTTSALRAEKIVNKEGLDAKLISTPRQFSSDCGLSMKFPWELLEKILEILKERKIDFEAYHRL